MSQRTLFYLIVLVLAGMATILFINVNSLFSAAHQERYVAYNDVKGMDIQRGQLLYTLNFDQQNQIITEINRSIPVGAPGAKPDQALNFSKLIIYRFKGSNLVLIPIRYENDELIYRIPQLKAEGFFKDISQGGLKRLIAETYDHS